jgi:hypothetical protein
LELDALTSRIEKRKKGPDEHPRTQTGRQRRRTTRTLKRTLAKNRRRLHGWVQRGHYAAANFMLQNHDILIKPKLQDTSHGCEIVAEESKALGASLVVLESRSSFKAQKRRCLVLGIVFFNSNGFGLVMFEASKFDLILVAGVLVNNRCKLLKRQRYPKNNEFKYNHAIAVKLGKSGLEDGMIGFGKYSHVIIHININTYTVGKKQRI